MRMSVRRAPRRASALDPTNFCSLSSSKSHVASTTAKTRRRPTMGPSAERSKGWGAVGFAFFVAVLDPFFLGPGRRMARGPARGRLRSL